MPRFFIEIHVDSLSEWDDEGTVTGASDLAVALAVSWAREALAATDSALADDHVVAVIRDQMDASIATVYVRITGALRIEWATNRTPAAA